MAYDRVLAAARGSPEPHWSDPDFPATTASYLYPHASELETQADLVKLDTFARLGEGGTVIGPRRRAAHETPVLSMRQTGLAGAINMQQGEYGTRYFLNVLQCQALMCGARGAPHDIVQACGTRSTS